MRALIAPLALVTAACASTETARVRVVHAHTLVQGCELLGSVGTASNTGAIVMGAFLFGGAGAAVAAASSHGSEARDLQRQTAALGGNALVVIDKTQGEAYRCGE